LPSPLSLPDHRNATADQVGNQRRQAIVLKFGIAEKDFDVPAFHIAALIEGFPIEAYRWFTNRLVCDFVVVWRQAAGNPQRSGQLMLTMSIFRHQKQRLRCAAANGI
jgi:hypothetical protein